MKIKMRHSKNKHCNSCGCTEALNFFDLKIGEIMLTICDECNSEIADKTIKAKVFVNHRPKQPEDMKIIRRRSNGTYIEI